VKYFVIASGESGIHVYNGRSREEVAAMLRDPDDGGHFSRDPQVLDKVPPCNDGHFAIGGDGTKVLVIRGEIVTLDDLTVCPCGSGMAFKACHGAEEQR
jgi:hypothetical protein